MKSIGLLMLMSIFCLCQGAPPSSAAIKPNLKFYYYKSGIDFAFQQLLAQLDLTLKKGVNVPPQTFSNAFFSGSTSNFKLLSYKLPTVAYTGKKNEFTLTFNGEAFSVSTDLAISFFGFRLGNTVTVTTSNTGLKLTFAVLGNPPDKMIMKTTDCSVNFNNLDLQFGSWNFIQGLLQGYGKNYLKTSFCKILSQSLDLYLDKNLNQRVMSAKILKDIVYRYGLTSDGEFSNEVAIFNHLGIAENTPIPSNPVTLINHSPSSMYEICVSEQGVQSVFDSYYNGGYINYKIPVNETAYLNLFKKTKGELFVNMTAYQVPTIKIKSGYVESLSYVISEFLDKDSNTLAKVKGFYFVKANIDFEDIKTKFTVSYLNSTLQVLVNNLSGVSNNDIIAAVNKADNDNVASINSKLSFSLPPFLYLSFSKPHATYYEGYLCFSTDFKVQNYKP